MKPHAIIDFSVIHREENDIVYPCENATTIKIEYSYKYEEPVSFKYLETIGKKTLPPFEDDIKRDFEMEYKHVNLNTSTLLIRIGQPSATQ